MTLLAAKAFGADAVAITDLRTEALDKAKELGASHTYRIERGKSPEQVAEEVKAQAAPDGFDIVIDCAGFESTMKVPIAAMRNVDKYAVSTDRTSFHLLRRLWRRLGRVGWSCWWVWARRR